MPRNTVAVPKYFTLCQLNQGEKLRKVKCIFCETKLSNNGTRMLEHIKKCKNISDSRRQNCLKGSNDQALLNTTSSNNTNETADIDNNADEMAVCCKW